MGCYWKIVLILFLSSQYVLHTDALSLEEIEASTLLDGKIASASSIKEVKQNLDDKTTWETVGSGSTSSVTLPSNFEELLIVVNQGATNWKYPLYIIKEYLETTVRQYPIVYNVKDVFIKKAILEISNNRVKLDGEHTDDWGTTSFTVYYK